ncbi:radical SAM protein, partial [Salinispora arenicola]|nr:radical SAM protein [Salinispora arenicola]
MLARAGDLDYVAEFVTALNDCADHCAFYDFCRGSQAGNRYFEHATFTARETTYCRTTRQASRPRRRGQLTPQG